MKIVCAAQTVIILKMGKTNKVVFASLVVGKLAWYPGENCVKGVHRWIVSGLRNMLKTVINCENYDNGVLVVGIWAG